MGEFEIQLDQLKIVKSVKQAVTGHWGKQVGHVAPEILNDQYLVNRGYKLFPMLFHFYWNPLKIKCMNPSALFCSACHIF